MRDIFILVPKNIDITNQLPISAIVKLDISKDMYQYQAPIILALFGNYEIKLSSIGNEEDCKLLHTYYFIRKL